MVTTVIPSSPLADCFLSVPKNQTVSESILASNSLPGWCTCMHVSVSVSVCVTEMVSLLPHSSCRLFALTGGSWMAFTV